MGENCNLRDRARSQLTGCCIGVSQAGTVRKEESPDHGDAKVSDGGKTPAKRKKRAAAKRNPAT